MVGRVCECLTQGRPQFEHFTKMSYGVLECDRLCFRITCLWFCNKRFGIVYQLIKKGHYLCWTLYITLLRSHSFLFLFPHLPGVSLSFFSISPARFSLGTVPSSFSFWSRVVSLSCSGRQQWLISFESLPLRVYYEPTCNCSKQNPFLFITFINFACCAI